MRQKKINGVRAYLYPSSFKQWREDGANPPSTRSRGKVGGARKIWDQNKISFWEKETCKERKKN